MTCTCSCLSPFKWPTVPRPSIFAVDSNFYRGASTGVTMGDIQTAAVARTAERTGKNPGSIPGLSSVADALIERGRSA